MMIMGLPSTFRIPILFETQNAPQVFKLRVVEGIRVGIIVWSKLAESTKKLWPVKSVEDGAPLDVR